MKARNSFEDGSGSTPKAEPSRLGFNDHELLEQTPIRCNFRKISPPADAVMVVVRSMDASPTDSELVSALNRGDIAAFDALYDRYRDWVFTLAQRWSKNHEDALDVVQETFCYVARKFPGFELRAEFKTFLYPAVKNLSIAARRKRTRFTSGTDLLVRFAIEGFEPPNGDAPEDLRELFERLPEGQCEVLLLRFVDDFTLDEIAAALEIPLGTVKSRLHNALRALRDDPRTRHYFDLDAAD